MRHATAFQITCKLTRMCLLLGALFCVGAHAQNALQPTQVVNLYLKALVNHDLRSATEINDYIRPYNGQNIFDLQVIMNLSNDILPMTDEQEPEHERLFRKALMAAVRSSSCRATASEVERDVATGNRIANVNYICRISGARIQTDANAFENAASDSERAEIMSGMIAKLNDAPIEKEISGILQLEELKAGDKSWWRLVSVGGAVAPFFLVLESLLAAE